VLVISVPNFLIVTLYLTIHEKWVLPLLENLMQATDGLLKKTVFNIFRHINNFPVSQRIASGCG